MSPTRLYSALFASKLVLGVDAQPRPWNLNQVVLDKTTATTTLLDIGCGDARKMLPLADRVQQISALEPSPAMRALAQEKILTAKINNIRIIEGDCYNIPFADNSFDVVTCNLAPWDIEELYRVLKPGGCFINETIGCEDKLEFKRVFGKDANGHWRGQRMLLDNATFIHQLRTLLEPRFQEINIANGFWETYYTPQGLLELCECTPTISEFNVEKDKPSFDAVINRLMTEKGIKLMQNRLLITARKSPPLSL